MTYGDETALKLLVKQRQTGFENLTNRPGCVIKTSINCSSIHNIGTEDEYTSENVQCKYMIMY